jgi:hypothetical protein
MNVGYVLAPQAALDLVEIWRYIKEQTSITMAVNPQSSVMDNAALSSSWFVAVA